MRGDRSTLVLASPSCRLRRVHPPPTVIPQQPLQMSKPMKLRGLAGQGIAVYKPEAIRVHVILVLT